MRRSGRRSHSGQALLEFALVFPVIVLVFLGVFDFGRYMFASSEVADAAREGVRTAIVNQNVDDITARAAEQAVALGIPSSPPGTCPTTANAVCVSFLLDGDVSASPPPSACSSPPQLGCQAVVTVTYDFTPVTPIINSIIGSLVITSTAAQPLESICTTSGCPVP